MKQLWIGITAALLASLGALPVRAQGDIRSLSASREGSGRLSIRGGTDQDLTRAEVVLDRNGNATLRFSPRRGAMVVMYGRWSGGRSGNVSVDINRSPGNPDSDARGTIRLDRRGEFDRVDLNGTLRGNRFTLDFTARDSGGGSGGGRFEEVDTTLSGSGRLSIDGSRDVDLDRVRVLLRRNGDAEIRLDGQRSVTLTGRWSDRNSRDDSVDLDVNNGFGRDGASGRGTVWVRSRSSGGLLDRIRGNSSQDRVQISGTTRGRRFTVRFGEGRSNGGGSDSSPIREMDTTSRGRGRLELDGDRDQDLNRASVVLRRGGEAEIRFFGDGQHTYKGRWYAGRGDDIELRLTGDFGRVRASAEGTLNIRRSGGFDRIELRGQAGSRRFTIRFDAD